MQEKFDIYRSKRNLEAIQRLIDNSSISSENKAHIQNYVNDHLSQISEARLYKSTYILIRIAKLLKKDFNKVNKKDIQKLVEKINDNKEFSDWTKHDYKVQIKKFYKWLKGNNEFYPEEVRWIKAGNIKLNEKLPENLISEEEVLKLIQTADHPRNKAFIAILYDSGARIGEILTMKIRNVNFDNYGAIIKVTGKTGDRRIRLTFSTPYLAEWLNRHPRRENPDESLWVTLASNSKGKPLDYASVRKMLIEIAKKAGVSEDKVNPHNFRHSRATWYASKLTEAQMKELFGWRQDSKMASIYVHLSGRDIDKAVLQAHGTLPKEEESKKTKLSPKKCYRCGKENPPTNMYCGNCGEPLDFNKLREMQMKADNWLEEILRNDPELAKMIIKSATKQGKVEELLQMLKEEKSFQK
jgi:integrase